MNAPDTPSDAEIIKLTIGRIRGVGRKRINKLKKRRLRDLWHQWSMEMFCSQWIEPTDKNVEAFIEWATTAPCDEKV